MLDVNSSLDEARQVREHLESDHTLLRVVRHQGLGSPSCELLFVEYVCLQDGLALGNKLLDDVGSELVGSLLVREDVRDLEHY